MCIARTILALLVALSVAALPAAGGAIDAAKAANMAVVTMETMARLLSRPGQPVRPGDRQVPFHGDVRAEVFQLLGRVILDGRFSVGCREPAPILGRWPALLPTGQSSLPASSSLTSR